ncbi:MAG: GTPase Era [Ilumatobacteraceae bacterium]|jgi:GTP-binding protein Era
MRSGFVALVGRPNVGKSSLANAICGTKVTIVSPVPQTTRRRVRGVLHRPDAQVVLVDTPGLHDARTALGRAANDAAREAAADVDLACLVLDATAGWTPADEAVARGCDMARTVIVVNKADAAGAAAVGACLAATASLGAAAWHPVSARTGEGVAALVSTLVAAMPEGPPLYPEGTIRETDDDEWVAELVREELMRRTREEVPHSIATRVVERDGRIVRCEIVVERESQKGIVIGAGGAMLAAVRAAVAPSLPAGTRLELQVRVVRNWQRDEDQVARLVE